MVLAGAGGISHDSLVKLAEQHFGHLKNSDKNYRPENVPKFTGSQASLATPHSLLCLVLHVCNCFRPC